MAKLKHAYGSREDLENAINLGKIPPNTFVYTKEGEIFFYNLNCELCSYKERNKFTSREEAETWINKYNCQGEILSIHENDICNIYIVGYDNCLQPIENIDAIPIPDIIETGQILVAKTVDEEGKITETEGLDEITLLINADLLPAVYNTDGKILTDNSGRIILRY